MTQAEFLARAAAVHESRYDYSQAIYTQSHHKLLIRCQQHGEFSQTASAHLNGHGCELCHKERAGYWDTSTFRAKCQELYPGLDFLSTTYQPSGYAYFTCPKHGQQKQLSQGLLSGRGGCTQCKKSKRDAANNERKCELLAKSASAEYSKKCACCNRELPASEFSINRARPDGLAAYCRACKKGKNAASRLANPQYDREYRTVRKNQIAQRRIRYYINNYEVFRARNLRRRAREKAAGAPITAAIVRQLWYSQKGLCVYCKVQLGDKPGAKWAYHIDHIMPLSKGGTNDPKNLQCLCPKCNMQKSNKLPEEAAKILSGSL